MIIIVYYTSYETSLSSKLKNIFLDLNIFDNGALNFAKTIIHFLNEQ
jgi:hypothetical protein